MLTPSNLQRLLAVQILVLEELQDVLRRQLLAPLVGHAIDDPAEIAVHRLRQHVAEFLLHDIGHAALARLAVDADDRAVIAPDVVRIDRQVGHLPRLVGMRRAVLQPLVDRVLVRAGEGGENQVAAVGLAQRHVQLRAALVEIAHLADVAEIELRVDALREHIQRQRDDIDIARPLAVAEERPLHARRAGQQAQLGRGDARAAIVVRVQADDRALRMFLVRDEPLDLVRVLVRHHQLDRVGQVEDDRVFLRVAPRLADRLADLQREIDLGGGEAFRRILEADFRARHGFHAVLNLLRAAHGDVDHALLVEAEGDPALRGRGRIIEMHDGARRAANRLERALDQLFLRLDQHLHPDVVRNAVLLDQAAREIEFDLRRGGKADLDFLEADLHQQREILELLLDAHRHGERLVAVAQIDAAPGRRLVDRARGPRAFGHLHGRERPVFRIRGGHIFLNFILISSKSSSGSPDNSLSGFARTLPREQEAARRSSFDSFGFCL